MNEDLHVCVCVPSLGSWTAPTARAMALMFAHAAANRYIEAATQRLSILTAESSMLSSSRQNLVKKAMQSSATHLLFLDSDMYFPPWTLQKLLEAKRSIVAANCTTRVEPVVPTAFDFTMKRVDSRGKTGLQQVQQVGMAVMLIKREVFEKTRPPHFLMDWIPERMDYCGEDIYFTQLAQAAGFKLWIDHDLSQQIQHVGTRSYGFDDVKEG